MTVTLKRWCVVVGLWLCRLGGFVPYEAPALDVLESARIFVAQANPLGGSGEYRRNQALRALMNRHPEARERDLCLAIELAVRERSA